MGIVVRNSFGISVGDAMRAVLGALPNLAGVEVNTGPPKRRFDRDTSSPLVTWKVGVRQNKASKAKDNSHEKEAYTKTFG